MKPADVFADPIAFATRLGAAQVACGREVQALWLRQLESFSRRGLPTSVEFDRVDMPMPVFSVEKNEAQLREYFHALADTNLAIWGHMAEALKHMPGWAKWMNKAPGEFWTGVFDKFTSLDTSTPANDAPTMPREPELKVAPLRASPQPELLDAPRGKADELTLIKGIGPKLSQLLNTLGIYHFAQIAAWTPEQCDWIDDKLAFKGRVQREAWVEQARELAKQAA